MEGLVGLLIFVGVVALAVGPMAFILTLVLFGKLNRLEEKMRTLAPGRRPDVSPPPVPTPRPVVEPAPQPPQTEMPKLGITSHPEPQPAPTEPKAPTAEVESYWPVRQTLPTTVQKTPEPTVPKPPAVAVQPTVSPVAEKPAAAVASRKPVLARVALEQKIGTTAALIAGIITVIVGVAFFLKYIYENAWFGPEARVCVVAAGGLVAAVVGEITRRRGYEIVAKGVTALGFALFYAAIFSASRVYMLIGTQSAFVLAIVITAGAMAYAVALNEVVIAFLSLLGGYLSPIVISSGQNLAMPLFSYLLALAAGALGCAMFRRWRAVNWIAMVGTYLLYTGWFEKFYSPDQMALALSWLAVFGGLFLIQPIVYGLVRKVAARAEDVGLVVANSAVLFYYLWRILYAEHPQAQAIAAATVGLVHLGLMAAVILRCRDDQKLQAALGVLGTAFVTTAVPLYFSALNPTLLSWSVEAVALTYIGICYRSRWTKAMAFLVSAIASAGLLYHLPLHGVETFEVVFNAPFGTWLFVSAAILVCHGLWRWMARARDVEGDFSAQVYYVAGALLTAAGCAMEWFFYCRDVQGEPLFLKGMMVVAAALTAALLVRPVCPTGAVVRGAGVLAAFAGAAYTAMAMTGVYTTAFRLFANGPFALACGYAAVVLACGGWIRRTDANNPHRDRTAAGLCLMAMGLLFVLLAEQGYWYWYCRNEFVQAAADWRASAAQTVAICWAGYGIAILLAALRFNLLWLKAGAVISAGLSAVALFGGVPLHSGAEFRFVLNLPFIAWVTVSAALIAGHVLWRLTRSADAHERNVMAQAYYASGVLLAAIGWTLEWYAHCRWHVSGAVGTAHYLMGTMLLAAAITGVFLARPLPPAGNMVRALGVLAAFGGAVFAVFAMQAVYTDAFMLFFNGPFALAAVTAAALPAGAWLIRRQRLADPQWAAVPTVMLLSGLVLVWVLLSRQVYAYWACRNAFDGPVQNWRFSAQMYMSVTWAVYGAALVVGGFVFRARGVRYLSLLLFAVLLAKIFLKDTVTLRIEYRIAAFLTTGLILVGVSFVYQFLKKKGFFEEH